MQVKVRNFIARLTLSQRFMLSGLVVLLAGMVGISIWVARQIETGVIHRTGGLLFRAIQAGYIGALVVALLGVGIAALRE